MEFSSLGGSLSAVLGLVPAQADRLPMIACGIEVKRAEQTVCMGGCWSSLVAAVGGFGTEGRPWWWAELV